MVEISIERNIDADILMDVAPDKIEDLVNEKIRDAICEDMIKALDNMAFVEMKYNDENNTFKIEASVMLCAKNDIATSSQIQAQLMAKYGLNEEQILEVLNIGINESGGF